MSNWWDILNNIDREIVKVFNKKLEVHCSERCAAWMSCFTIKPEDTVNVNYTITNSGIVFKCFREDLWDSDDNRITEDINVVTPIYGNSEDEPMPQMDENGEVLMTRTFTSIISDLPVKDFVVDILFPVVKDFTENCKYIQNSETVISYMNKDNNEEVWHI